MRWGWVLLAAVACDEPAGDSVSGASAGQGDVSGEGEGEGEGEGPSVEAPPPPIVVADLDDYLAKLHALRCDWAIKCEIQAAAALREVQRDSCVLAVRPDFDRQDLYNGGVAAGRLTYSQPDAQACIRELAAIEGCAELWARHTAVDVCPGALVGNQEQGGACTLREECGPDGRCFYEGACPGVCLKGETGRGLNDECDVSPQCVEGLRCLGGVCRLARLEGEECGDSSECGPGLHCAQRGDPAGTCTPVGKQGELCWADLAQGTASSCVGDLVCSGARRDNAGHCEIGLDLGDPCSAESPCRVGTRCVEDRCQSAVGPLKTCRAHAQCPAGLGCFGFDCRAAGLEGEACDRDRACDQGICRNGECAFLPVGAECELRWADGSLKVCPDGYHCGFEAAEGEGEGEGEAGADADAVRRCVEGPGFGEACVEGPAGAVCKEVLRCHGGFCGRPCVP